MLFYKKKYRVSLQNVVILSYCRVVESYCSFLDGNFLADQ